MLFYSISKRILSVAMENKIGNSKEKEIRSFSWKRQRAKRKLLLARRVSHDKELYTPENGKFEL